MTSDSNDVQESNVDTTKMMIDEETPTSTAAKSASSTSTPLSSIDATTNANDEIIDDKKRKGSGMEDVDENPGTKISKSIDSTTPLPSQIISSKGCIVQTLTVSDQHATLLLSSSDNNQNENDINDKNDAAESTESTKKSIKSILKLTLIPFHRETLGSNPVVDPQQPQNQENAALKPELKLLDNNPIASQQILSFLQSYNFQLKSESGAEYSYYDASPSFSSSTSTSTVVTSGTASKAGSFNVELISPASERQINRSMPSHSTSLIEETPTIYNTIVQPYIQSIVDSGSLNWIQNILSGKKEKERLLINHDDFIINIDTKWKSHPDPFVISDKKDWYQHKATEDLYCLGIMKQSSIQSIRDLTADHIPLLRTMKQEGLSMIENVYGIPCDQIRVFVHYHPQFYHFHIHYTRINNEIGSQVERGHLVEDIIQNLELDGDYYKKRTISFKLKVSSPLYLLIKQRLLELELESESKKEQEKEKPKEEQMEE